MPYSQMIYCTVKARVINSCTVICVEVSFMLKCECVFQHTLSTSVFLALLHHNPAYGNGDLMPCNVT